MQIQQRPSRPPQCFERNREEGVQLCPYPCSSFRDVWPPGGESGSAIKRQTTHRVSGMGEGEPETRSRRFPQISTEWQRPSQSEPPLKKTLYGENLPMVRLRSPVFLRADSSEPAHLSQLILLAGDVETNPGPDLCGICNKRVASNSHMHFV